jgi:anti-sigma-K factor RskA
VDCNEVRDLLDAYALGAASAEEAYAIEGHVAGCPDCWAELDKSRRTASLLAVSVPMRRAPDHLRRRIMRRAQADERIDTPTSRVRRLWPSRRPAIAGLGLAGIALVLASVLQFQLTDLRGDRDQLAEELSAASSEIEQQRQIVAVLSASDSQKLPMQPVALRSEAESVYNWSRESAAGFVLCNNFPALPAGRVYQVWFVFQAGAEPVATFLPSGDGGCQIPMDLSRVESRPAGIGISIEPEGGSMRPSGGWFAYASFEPRSRGGSGLGFTVSTSFGP